MAVSASGSPTGLTEAMDDAGDSLLSTSRCGPVMTMKPATCSSVATGSVFHEPTNLKICYGRVRSDLLQENESDQHLVGVMCP